MKKRLIAIIFAIFILVLIVLSAFAIYFKRNNQKTNTTDSYEKNSSVVTPEQKAAKETAYLPSTKAGYEKSLVLLENEKGLELENILFMKGILSDPSDKNKLENKILYEFYSSDSHVYTSTGYDLTTGNVSILEKKNQAESNYSTGAIPYSVIDMGYEGAKALLEKDSDYIKYKEKYPKLFEGENDSVVKDNKYGWEWRFGYSLSGSSTKSIFFDVNVNSKKVVIVSKYNVDQLSL